MVLRLEVARCGGGYIHPDGKEYVGLNADSSPALLVAILAMERHGSASARARRRSTESSSLIPSHTGIYTTSNGGGSSSTGTGSGGIWNAMAGDASRRCRVLLLQYGRLGHCAFELHGGALGVVCPESRQGWQLVVLR